MAPSKTWKSVVIWSILSAAFIGPGTVTTALTAGSLFGLDLLWAVVVSTIACIVLQEVAARIAIGSGLNIGRAISRKFGVKNGRFLQWGIGGTVIAGCAAYEAGNLLGAVSGLTLFLGIHISWLIIAVSIAAFLILWYGTVGRIFKVMLTLVGVMGMTFLWVAITGDFSFVQVLRASMVPVMPAHGGIILLGLMGTTIVPYNLFLAAGISEGQTIPFMRLGLIVSVLLGGVITGAILVVGAGMKDFSSFSMLFSTMELQAGKMASITVATGLFAAGFSSAITAPYASSVIANTIFGVTKNTNLRLVKIVVLAIGVIVAAIGFQPVRVILIVQALNGLILPVIVILLILLVNDEEVVPASFSHGKFYNLILLLVLAAVLVISLTNVDKAFKSVGMGYSTHQLLVYSTSAVITAIIAWVVIKIR